MMLVPAPPIMGDMTSMLHTPSRVVLADRAGSARRALVALLDDLDDVVLVGQAATRTEPTLGDARADVLVIDDRLVRHGHGSLPAGLRVIVVGVDDPAFAERARSLGADAWVVKDRADEYPPPLLAAR